MAKIEELINQVNEPRLRTEIAAEVKKLKAQKKFGLVFEEHLPETVRLPGFPIHPGELVAERGSSGNDLWLVKKANSRTASCVRPDGTYTAEERDFPIKDIVVIKRFGEPIYPVLMPVDRVNRGGPDKPYHTLINADNFHALQLLLYCYEGQVDVIYIDPPYNTGASDWKYNNDYVDKTDSWRHSKWLSMMKKRLILAKRLLRNDGVLIVTIDENEQFHLGLLLEELFPDKDIQSAVIVINPGGTFGNNLSSVHEYALFCIPKGQDLVKGRRLTDKEIAEYDLHDEIGPYQLGRLRKRGTGSLRSDNKSMFYAVYVDPKTLEVKDIGSKMELSEKSDFKQSESLIPVYPIDEKGIERRWNYGRETMLSEIKKGEIIAEKDKQGRIKIYKKERLKSIRRLPTVWTGGQYAAGDHGSKIVNQIIGKPNAFPFPKSIYAVHDCIASVCSDRPDAIILDFFAGSGTTYHATCMLNALDNGRRRSILVTNNEVPEEKIKELVKRGLSQGDDEFEKEGITESITWPRCKFVTNGKRDDGSTLSGEYLAESPFNGYFADGFQENIEYFKFNFVSPDAVSMGQAFEAILPILWMKAGCLGGRESSRGSKPWFIPKNSPYAVLIKEQEFPAFRKELKGRKDITHVFFVTDSEENFQTMSNSIGLKVETVQLYRSYLENFRINTKLPGLL